MIKYHRLFLGWKMCAIAAIVAMAHAPALAETPDLLADATVRPDCGAPPDLTRLDGALDRTALRLTAGDPIKIVAIGSSSTAGAGASSAATTYPARLSVELNRLMPRDSIAVLNRGINGQEVGEMLARLPDDVIREAPDLILWQVGTNAVLSATIRSGPGHCSSARACANSRLCRPMWFSSIRNSRQRC
jgi:acyl-CoA thioesterase-1